MSLTNDDLEAMEKLEREATAGPWSVSSPRPDDDLHEHWCKFPNGNDTTLMNEKDARFISAARTFVPRAIARIRELEAAQRTVELTSMSADAQCDQIRRMHAQLYRALQEAELALGVVEDMLTSGANTIASRAVKQALSVARAALGKDKT